MFARTDASSIESGGEGHVRDAGERNRRRTRGDDDAFPDGDMPQRTPHLSLPLGFNSSRELIYEHDGGVTWGTYTNRSTYNVNELAKFTEKRNGKCQFALVSTRKPTRQPDHIHAQGGRDHERFDISVQFGPTPEAFETPVDQQVFSDGRLCVDSSELWADAECETGMPRSVDDGDAFDLDISCIRDDIPAFRFTRFQLR